MTLSDALALAWLAIYHLFNTFMVERYMTTSYGEDNDSFVEASIGAFESSVNDVVNEPKNDALIDVEIESHLVQIAKIEEKYLKAKQRKSLYGRLDKLRGEILSQYDQGHSSKFILLWLKSKKLHVSKSTLLRAIKKFKEER